MPRSRKFRKSQNQPKPQWGKNNPETKAKNRRMFIVTGIIIAAIAVLAVFLVLNPGLFGAAPSASPSPSATPSASPTATATTTASPSPAATPLTSPAGQYSATGTRILLQTSMGDVTLQMRDDKPITATNFVNLVKQGFYDGTLFHRVISGFMIQGGQNQTQNVASIADEIGTNNRNVVGTITMAKTSQPNSATSEFFINVGDNSQITYQDGTRFDDTYSVFGQVIGGMDIVMKISQVQTQANPLMGNENSQPVNPVTLIKAIVLP